MFGRRATKRHSTDVDGCFDDRRRGPARHAAASGESTAVLPTVPRTTRTSPTTLTTTFLREGFAVRSVTDGDTLVLADARRVRLAQVDAPETDECFGSQSTRGLRALVEGRHVTLRRPSNGPEKDQYGRTLAEVSVAGVSVNEQLVRDGAAEWYDQFAREDADLAQRLRSSELEAKSAGRGLWSACAAGRSVDAPRPASQPLLPSRGTCLPAYPDVCIPPPSPDLDCPEIGRRVRVDHAHGDPHRLDANQDGWGCESYG